MIAEAKAAASGAIADISAEVKKNLLPIAIKAWAVFTLLLLAGNVAMILIYRDSVKKSDVMRAQVRQYEVSRSSNELVYARLVRENSDLAKAARQKQIIYMAAESNYEKTGSAYSNVSTWRDALSIYKSNRN